MKYILFILTILGISNKSNSQQVPYIQHYQVNPYFLNPATAGLNGTNLFLDYRRQWVGVAGAPETQFFTLDAPIANEKMGLGFTIINDINNIIGNTGGWLSYAYKVKFSETHHLDFGISAGITQSKILFDKINAESKHEALLFSAAQNATNVDATFGINYQFGNFNLGAVAYHLLSGSYQYENTYERDSLTFSLVPHYFGMASYQIDVKPEVWTVTPGILFRSTQGSYGQFDVNTKVQYKKNIWGNLSYRNKVGYAVSLGGVIDRKYMVAYTYEISSNELVKHNAGTHELMFGIKLGKGNGQSGMSEKELERLEEQNTEILEKSDYLEEENKKLREQIDEQNKLIRSYIDGLEELKKSVEKDQKELEELIKNKEVILDNSLNNSNGTESLNNSSSENSTANESNIDKDGEVGEGQNDIGSSTQKGKYAVIIGAAKDLKDVKDFQQIVKREYDLDTKVIQNERKTWYLVTTLSTNDKLAAAKELERVRMINTKDIYIGKPWVYKGE